MRSHSRYSLSLTLLCSISACLPAPPGEEPPDTAPSIRGMITQADRVDVVVSGPGAAPTDPSTPVSSADPPSRSAAVDHVGTILIEEDPAVTSGDAKASVRVTRSARILVQDAEGWRPGTFDDLTIGREAGAWFSGPVMQSYPVQATATTVVIYRDRPSDPREQR